jgi:hypothetical protein
MCGHEVPRRVWQEALDGLFLLQEARGPPTALVTWRLDERYAFRDEEPAEARGFWYLRRMQDGPLGEKTVSAVPATGSMTTAGIAGLVTCREALATSRRFPGRDRRKVREALRDALAWLQEHFTVQGNPGREDGAHHLYYLYGLERAGMLTGRRFIGTHDWYREGADHLLALEQGRGWGNHVGQSFAILFLKRATRPPTVTGD